LTARPSLHTNTSEEIGDLTSSVNEEVQQKNSDKAQKFINLTSNLPKKLAKH